MRYFNEQCAKPLYDLLRDGMPISIYLSVPHVERILYDTDILISIEQSSPWSSHHRAFIEPFCTMPRHALFRHSLNSSANLDR